MPLDALAVVAKAFAAVEPATVVGYLDDKSDERQLRGNQPGDRWYHQYQRELSSGCALARQWAGLEQEADMRRWVPQPGRVRCAGAKPTSLESPPIGAQAARPSSFDVSDRGFDG
jgi:hypothetical protein